MERVVGAARRRSAGLEGGQYARKEKKNDLSSLSKKRYDNFTLRTI